MALVRSMNRENCADVMPGGRTRGSPSAVVSEKAVRGSFGPVILRRLGYEKNAAIAFQAESRRKEYDRGGMAYIFVVNEIAEDLLGLSG